MAHQVKSVNFGAGKTGLSTIGYVLINSDGTTYAARTTAGVAEMVTGSGIYWASVTVPDSWNGSILWDTGEALPKYAADSINITATTAGGTSTFYTGAANIDAKGNDQLIKNVKSLLDQNKRIMSKIDDVHQTIVTQNTDAQKITEGIKDLAGKHNLVEEYLKALREMALRESERSEDMKLRQDFIKGLIKESLIKDSGAIESLIEAIAVLIEFQETKEAIQEAADVETVRA